LAATGADHVQQKLDDAPHKAAQRAGIEHAKQRGDRAYIGRKPSFTREQLMQVRGHAGAEGSEHRSDCEGNWPEPTDRLPDQG
jgi:hypothetical protein